MKKTLAYIVTDKRTDYAGNIIKRYPNHTVRAFSDKYDFEQHSWLNPKNWGRNIETAIESKYAGKGVKYKINIYGSKKLNRYYHG